MMRTTKVSRTQKIETRKKEQRKEFRKRLGNLMKAEYRYSARYEDSHVFDDGKAYINVDLTKVDTPFSPYSYDNRIEPEIYEFIEQETWFLPVDIPVVVNFDDDGRYTDEMKNRIRLAVKRHYSLEYEDNKFELRKSRRFGIFTFIIGIILLSVFITLSILAESKDPLSFENISKEIIQIFAWVFIWETVDRFAITGFDDSAEVLNSGQLALMEVQFGKPVRKN